jgi:hypothetical protein
MCHFCTSPLPLQVYCHLLYHSVCPVQLELASLSCVHTAVNISFLGPVSYVSLNMSYFFPTKYAGCT